MDTIKPTTTVKSRAILALIDLYDGRWVDASITQGRVVARLENEGLLAPDGMREQWVVHSPAGTHWCDSAQEALDRKETLAEGGISGTIYKRLVTDWEAME